METQPLLPLVEANQGLISIAALFVAFGIVAFEHFRAEIDLRRRRRRMLSDAFEHIRVILSYADDAKSDDPATIGGLRFALQVAASSFRGYAQSIGQFDPFQSSHYIAAALVFESAANESDADAFQSLGHVREYCDKFRSKLSIR